MKKITKFSLFFLLSNSIPLILFGYTSTQSIIIVYHAIEATDKSIYQILEAFLGIFAALIISSKYRLLFREHFIKFALICFFFDSVTDIFLLINPFIKGLFDAIVCSFFVPIFWNITDYFINIYYSNVEERIVFQSWLRTTQAISSSFGAFLVFYSTASIENLVMLSILASFLWYSWAVMITKIMKNKVDFNYGNKDAP